MNVEKRTQCEMPIYVLYIYIQIEESKAKMNPCKRHFVDFVICTTIVVVFKYNGVVIASQHIVQENDHILREKFIQHTKKERNEGNILKIALTFGHT